MTRRRLPSRERERQHVSLDPFDRAGLPPGTHEHLAREVEPGDDAALALGREAEIAGAAARVEHARTRLDDGCAVIRRQRRSSPIVITWFIASYTGAIRSNMVRTPSGWRMPLSWRHRPLAPARHQGVVDADLVEGAGDDEVDEILDRLRTVVEAGCGEQDHRSCLVQGREPAEMDRRERRLTRDEDELAALLQSDGGGAVDEVRHRARRERPHGAHRARADDVGIDPRRAARVRALVVVDAVDRDPVAGVTDEALEHLVARQGGVAVELGGDHLDAGGRGDEPDLAVGSGERLQQPGRVGRARGAGDSEEDAHQERA